jgi:hypothetical protein
MPSTPLWALPIKPAFSYYPADAVLDRDGNAILISNPTSALALASLTFDAAQLYLRAQDVVIRMGRISSNSEMTDKAAVTMIQAQRNFAALLATTASLYEKHRLKTDARGGYMATHGQRLNKLYGLDGRIIRQFDTPAAWRDYAKDLATEVDRSIALLDQKAKQKSMRGTAVLAAPPCI